jgi:hypothetical protein
LFYLVLEIEKGPIHPPLLVHRSFQGGPERDQAALGSGAGERLARGRSARWRGRRAARAGEQVSNASAAGDGSQRRRGAGSGTRAVAERK